METTMKKKLGDFTLAEIKGICTKQETCVNCPFRRKDYPIGYNFPLDEWECFLYEIIKFPYDEIDADMEVEIEDEA